MSVVWSIGFDDVPALARGSSLHSYVFEAFNTEGTTGPALNATNGRFGGGCLNTVRNTRAIKFLPSTYNVLIIGVAINAGLLVDTCLFSISNDRATPFTNDVASVWLKSDGRVAVRSNDGTAPPDDVDVATSAASVVNQSSWHWIEAKFDTVANTVEVRVDQGPDESVAAVSTTLSMVACDTVKLLRDSPSSTIFYDDVHVLDDSGSINNDFLGDGKIIHLRPEADVSPNQWAPSTGTNHFAVVDDEPLDTADFLSTSTVGNTERFDVEDLPQESNRVDFAWVNAMLFKDASGADAKLHCKSGTTVSESGTKTILTSRKYYQHFMDVDPNTGIRWTRAAIDAAQIGVEAV